MRINTDHITECVEEKSSIYTLLWIYDGPTHFVIMCFLFAVEPPISAPTPDTTPIRPKEEPQVVKETISLQQPSSTHTTPVSSLAPKKLTTDSPQLSNNKPNERLTEEVREDNPSLLLVNSCNTCRQMFQSTTIPRWTHRWTRSSSRTANSK